MCLALVLLYWYFRGVFNKMPLRDVITLSVLQYSYILFSITSNNDFLPFLFQPLETERPFYRTGTPLPSKHPILYIFSTNNLTELFKHAVHSPFFFSSKCHLFHNVTFFGPCIICILHTGVLKFKCQISVPNG
jgi:hypothetical protein